MNYFSWIFQGANLNCIAQDAMQPQDMTLKEHDKRFHPNGYKEGDECKFRDAHPEIVQQQQRSDNADNLINNMNIEKTDYGYEIKVNGKSVGRMDLTFGYGDAIREEVENSIDDEINLRQIQDNAKSVYIEDLSVDKAFRGNGYAKKLMSNLVKDYGDRQIVLRAFDTNGESNQDRLVDFYAKYGFCPIANTSSDGVIMLREPQKSVSISNESNGGQHSIVTPEEDMEYADAVARGDRNNALRMVIDVAAKMMPNTKVVDTNGNPMVVYHYGPKDKKFTVFNTDGNHEEFVEEGLKTGSFFYDSPMVDDNGTNSFRVFLNVKNPFVADAKDNLFNEMGIIMDDGIVDLPEDVAVFARERGNDGVMLYNVADAAITQKGHQVGREWSTNQIIAFYPSQIKSSEITYDDNGNLIPLSKRFDFNNPDIRY